MRRSAHAKPSKRAMSKPLFFHTLFKCFSGNHVFFIGANGQGKTNLLEAIGISSNLRSFRKSGMDGLVRVGTKTSRLFFRFKDEKEEDVKEDSK